MVGRKKVGRKKCSQVAQRGCEALLIVGDADSVIGLHSLQSRGYSIDCAADSAAALAISTPGDYGVILLDLVSTHRCELDDLPQLKRVYPRARFIVLDGEGSIEAAVAAIKAGAWDYLHQPISPAALGEKMAQAQTPAAESTQHNADPIVVYIGQHATAISSRAEVASRFGLSLDTVSSRVRAATGRTFIEYLHLCRLDQARQLLESTELNISQVAARVGFSTPQHFSRVFRKHMGWPPARYRLQERA